MRIVNREEFLKLPEGTLFSKYEPCCFDGLCIKGESLIFEGGNDFIYLSLEDAFKNNGSEQYFDLLHESQEKGIDLKMDFEENYSRDGLFEYDQLFAIWSPEDVKAFIVKLQSCVFDKDFK